MLNKIKKYPNYFILFLSYSDFQKKFGHDWGWQIMNYNSTIKHDKLLKEH